jgi:hypothetical protein
VVYHASIDKLLAPTDGAHILQMNVTSPAASVYADFSSGGCEIFPFTIEPTGRCWMAVDEAGAFRTFVLGADGLPQITTLAAPWTQASMYMYYSVNDATHRQIIFANGYLYAFDEYDYSIVRTLNP